MICKLYHMMQILVFYEWIYNLRDYLTYKVIINVFFALNMKICRILWFTIWSYDPRFHLPFTILHRILILTTLHEVAVNLWLSLVKSNSMAEIEALIGEFNAADILYLGWITHYIAGEEVKNMIYIFTILGSTIQKKKKNHFSKFFICRITLMVSNLFYHHTWLPLELQTPFT